MSLPRCGVISITDPFPTLTSTVSCHIRTQTPQIRLRDTRSKDSEHLATYNLHLRDGHGCVRATNNASTKETSCPNTRQTVEDLQIIYSFNLFKQIGCRLGLVFGASFE